MRVDELDRPRRGFTLVEILVVLAIILLVTVIALPSIYSALNGRQVTDAARVFTGALVGCRDLAIRHNAPRGIRLLPDPVLTDPPVGATTLGTMVAGTKRLAYNRMVAIEPAGDISEGRINVGPQYQSGANPANFPPRYRHPGQNPFAPDSFPFPDSSGIPNVLMVEESMYQGGFSSETAMPNPPTNWYWNVRVGDKLKIKGTGRTYTIVGPCTINPWAGGTDNGNFEMYVNVGVPGTPSPLVRSYYGSATAGFPVLPIAPPARPEFLFLVDGEDNDGDGWVDEGFDGLNNNPPQPGMAPAAGQDLHTDDLTEWERERWVGAPGQTSLIDAPSVPDPKSPSQEWVAANYSIGVQDAEYTIKRRPVPSQSAREVPLPGGIVIDATTWNTTQERSRLPVEQSTLYCDIMVDPRGNFVPSTPYSTPASMAPYPFLHFWLTEVGDVHPRGSVWGLAASGLPAVNPNVGQTYELPMTADAFGPNTTTPNYPPASNLTAPVLKGDRRLVTMFTRTGLIVTNPIDNIPETAGIPGEGFHVNDVNWPYRKAQLGQREAR